MRKWQEWLSVLVTLTCTVAPASATVEADTTDLEATGLPQIEGLAAKVDSFFEDEMTRLRIPGAVFLMLSDGEMIHRRGYGYANLATQRRVDPATTTWRVGSNSKTVTAAAVAQLAHQGHVELDLDVNRYLRSLHVPATFPEPVTLRHLLTHTGGFDDRLFGSHAATVEEYEPLAAYLSRKLPPRVLPPGEVISYNDHGTSLAGLVVEEVAGTSYADHVRTALFEPLGMTRSTFEAVDLPAPVRENLAVAYRWTGEEHEPYAYDYIIVGPAAGLMTTADDMGRFLAALLGDPEAEAALPPEVAEAMLTVQFRHHPKLDDGRGFGFASVEQHGVRTFYKDGQATGFTSRIFLVPEHGIAFFASVNRSIFGTGGFNEVAGFHRRLTATILNHVFPDSHMGTAPAEESEPPEVPADFDERADRFEGFYRSMEGSRHTLEKILHLFQGDLRIESAGDGTLAMGSGRWVELEPRLFQWHEGGPFYRAFRAGDDGRMSHLFLGPGAMERIPIRESQAVNLLAGLAFTVVFLVTLLAWPVAAWLRRRRGHGTQSRLPGLGALSTAAGLNLAFLTGFVAVFLLNDFQRFYKGVPATLAAVLALPVLAIPVTLAAVWFAVKAWREDAGGGPARVAYTLIVLVLLLFIPFLAQWNLLGWQY